jgi:hypothetical protein
VWAKCQPHVHVPGQQGWPSSWLGINLTDLGSESDRQCLQFDWGLTQSCSKCQGCIVWSRVPSHVLQCKAHDFLYWLPVRVLVIVYVSAHPSPGLACDNPT